MRNLINSALILFISSSCFGQYKTKKHIKHNKKAPVFQYVDKPIYARGLAYENNRLFIGNSDGSMYYIKLEKNSNQLITK